MRQVSLLLLLQPAKVCYASFNFTWDAETASNELAAKSILLPSLTEAPDVLGLSDAIGLGRERKLTT